MSYKIGVFVATIKRLNGKSYKVSINVRLRPTATLWYWNRSRFGTIFPWHVGSQAFTRSRIKLQIRRIKDGFANTPIEPPKWINQPNSVQEVYENRCTAFGRNVILPGHFSFQSRKMLLTRVSSLGSWSYGLFLPIMNLPERSGKFDVYRMGRTQLSPAESFLKRVNYSLLRIIKFLSRPMSSHIFL